ncbi:MAG: Gfo/Idh/MocA family oxidoreductase [Armatimonadota bacterium]|jgi:predicted dehydrogenase
MTNVAIIGLKGHQGVVLEGIAQMPDVRLAAAADDSEEALARIKGSPAADADTKTYGDHSEMLDKEYVHIAVHCGTDGGRADVLVECARRGLHTVSEKPLAMTLDELGAVREAVAQSDVRLSMLLTMRLEPMYAGVREAIAAGRIGEVVLATMQKSYKLGNRPEWQRDRRTFSGVIPFIGIHALDLIRWSTGREFTEAMAYQSNAAHPELRDMEDNATVALKLDNGGSASARLDYCRPATAPTHGDDRLRVAGSEGVIEARGAASSVTLMTQDEAPHELPLADGDNLFVDFVRSIGGRGESRIPAEDCFRMTEIVLKARAAAETGRPVPL